MKCGGGSGVKGEVEQSGVKGEVEHMHLIVRNEKFEKSF